MNILYLHIWKPLCYSFSISSYLAPKCFHISSAAISSPSSCSAAKNFEDAYCLGLFGSRRFIRLFKGNRFSLANKLSKSFAHLPYNTLKLAVPSASLLDASPPPPTLFLILSEKLNKHLRSSITTDRHESIKHSSRSPRVVRSRFSIWFFNNFSWCFQYLQTAMEPWSLLTKIPKINLLRIRSKSDHFLQKWLFVCVRY